MSYDLERLYQDAKAALAAKDYDLASDLLRQVLKADVDYKDAAQLLARAIRLSRRRWYNDPRTWGGLGALLLVGLGFYFFIKLQDRISQPVSSPVTFPTDTPAPTIAPPATITTTATSLPAPTPVPLTWRRVSIGQEYERDTVTALVIDPKDPDVLYAGMKNAGIFKSIDGGLSWRPAHQGLANAHVTSLLIDFQNPQILHAGTMDGIYKTVDGGETWLSTGEGTHVLMDPQDSAHLYARNNENIYESTNQGKSWKTVFSTQAGCPDKIHTWAIHPVEGKTLFIVGGEECEPGLYLSGDDGKTWALEEKEEFCTEGLSIGLDRQGKYHVADYCEGEYAFLIPLPTFDQLYSYWRNDSRLFKESLNGEQRLTLGRPDVGFVTVLTISPDNPDTLYAGGAGIAVSNDGGLTWVKLNNGLGAIYSVLHTDKANPSTLYLQVGTCYEHDHGPDVETQPLYVSNDYGHTWNLSLREGCYFIQDADGATIYRVEQSVEYSENAKNWISSIWRSEDEGKSWRKIFTPPYFQTLVANFSQSKSLYAYKYDAIYQEEGYFYSIDNGHTWKTMNTPASTKLCHGSTPQFIDKYRPIAIDPSDGNHVFVIENKAMLESHDSCETTTAFETAPNTNMNSITFDPKNSDMLYAGTDEGAYISFDSGETWNQINDGLLGATVVYSVVVDKDSNVYAATPYGIFKLEGK